jgi:hypothetical protein
MLFGGPAQENFYVIVLNPKQVDLLKKSNDVSINKKIKPNEIIKVMANEIFIKISTDILQLYDWRIVLIKDTTLSKTKKRYVE